MVETQDPCDDVNTDPGLFALRRLPELANELKGLYGRLDADMKCVFTEWMVAHAAAFDHVVKSRAMPGDGSRRAVIAPRRDNGVFGWMLEVLDGNGDQNEDLYDVVKTKPWVTTTIHPDTSRLVRPEQ